MTSDTCACLLCVWFSCFYSTKDIDIKMVRKTTEVEAVETDAPNAHERMD